MAREKTIKNKPWYHKAKLLPGQTIRDGRIWETIDGWECSTPPIPLDIRLIDGWDLKDEDQYFQKVQQPDFMRRVTVGPDGKFLWSAQQEKFILREKTRVFIKGYWTFINGVPTWIHGFHYHVLNYWKIGADTDDGKKEYRDRDRRRWMRWRMVELSDTIFGMIYGKHRRDGATIDGYNMMQLYPQTDFERNSGHLHKEGDSAKKGFVNMLVRPFLKQPKWLIPENDARAGCSIFRLIDPDSKKKTKVKNAVLELDDEEFDDAGGTLDFRGTVFNAYDGDKLIFAFLDETGKWKDTNVQETVNVTISCLSQGAGIVKVGNLYMPTTVEEMGKGGAKFLELWKDSSRASYSESTRTTVSGLCTLFIPAYDGLEGFVGPYGESIIDEPTPQQIAFLKKRYPKRKEFIGARQHIERRLDHLAQQGDWKKYYQFVRKHPCKEEDMFVTANQDTYFNKRIIEQTKLQIRANSHFADDLYQTGDLKWKDHRTKTEVVFVPNDVNGKFRFSGFPPDEIRNKYKSNGVNRSPLDHKKVPGVISLDPFAKATTKTAKTGSKGAALGFWAFDEQNELTRYLPGGGRRKGYKSTPSAFVGYVARPQSMTEFHEDILMLCHYTGLRLAFENNVYQIAEYFIKRGYADYLVASWEFIDDAIERISKQDVDSYGIYMNEDNKQRGMEALDRFINGNGFYLKGYHYDLIKEWRRYPYADFLEDHDNFNPLDSEKNDRTMATFPGLIYLEVCYADLDSDEYAYEKTVYDEESLTEEGVLRSDEAEMMAFLSEESEDDW
jgi:hypothetical protein